MTLGEFIDRVKPLLESGQLTEHSEMYEEVDGEFYEIVTLSADIEKDLILTCE